MGRTLSQSRKRQTAPKAGRKRGGSTPENKEEGHLGATEDKVGDRTGSGAGYDLQSGKNRRKGGVASS